MSLKTRSWTGASQKVGFYSLNYRAANPTINSIFGAVGKGGIEQCSTFNHSKRKGHWVGGGPFTLRLTKVEHSPVPGFYDQKGTVNTSRYVDSDFYVDGQVPGYNQTVEIGASENLLVTKGTQAIKECAPTTPQGSIAQAVAEMKDVKHMASQLARLRDFFRQYQKHRNRHVFSESGDAYLSGIFGWGPMLKDLCDLITNTIKYQKRLDQLSRDSGKWVRRKRSMGENSSTITTRSTGGFGHPALVTQFYTTSAGGYKDTTVTTSQRFWFVGAFMYYLPPSDGSYLGDIRRQNQLSRILYGSEILSPALVWQLMPWSWFGDWLGNIGDILDNYSNFTNDNLVMKYGYIMCETRTEIVEERMIPLRSGPIYPSKRTERICKQRRIASPFGFGVPEDAFSPRQLTILAALGGSKVR